MQKKEGYVQFANSQLDWLIRMSGELSKREYSALLAIVRYTFGFHRTKARISASFIATATGMRASHVPATLAKLAERGLIHVIQGENGKTNEIEFDLAQQAKANPFSRPLPKRETPLSRIGSIPSPELGGVTSPESGDKTIKETININKQIGQESEEEENCWGME